LPCWRTSYLLVTTQEANRPNQYNQSSRLNQYNRPQGSGYRPPEDNRPNWENQLQGRGCWRCGSSSHRIRDCPVAATDKRAPVTEARRTEAERPPLRDVRPIRETKVPQYRNSALIYAGSDVSITGEDVAWKFGWRIEDHEMKMVHVANNEPMAVIGAAYMTLCVGNRSVESEILITPDCKQLVLGINWLTKQG